MCLFEREKPSHSLKEAHMTSIADGSVIIQTSAQSAPSTLSWFGEVTLIAAYLPQHGVLTKISERVCFARRRFGHYDVIDFLVVLFGYAISGERTLEAFYERLQPFATPFMALFDRDQLPARSTLSRFLAALTMEPVEALRALFLDELLARSPKSGREVSCWIEQADSGRSSLSMAHARRPASELCPRQKNSPRPFADEMKSALLATPGASVEKSSVPVPSFCKPTPLSGSAVLATEATGSTGRNCKARSGSSVAISRHTACRKHAPCSD